MGPQAGKALRLGLLTASGILAVFGLLGVPFVVLLGVLTFQQLALAVLLTGLLIAALGALGLAGRDLSFAVPVRAPQARTPASFLLFGVAYGLVSMGCTFPLFLVGAVGPVARAGNPLAGLLGATSFGAGMASVMLIATLGLATSRGLTRERLRRAVPWVKRASNVVLIAAGLYIVYYVLVTPGFLAA
jgi:cytochrome c biogenesis protein CcdA